MVMISLKTDDEDTYDYNQSYDKIYEIDHRDRERSNVNSDDRNIIIFDNRTDVTSKYKIENISSNVNHPSHYTDGKIEVIDYIEDKKFDYCLGNAIKYISRAGKKNPDKTIEDLEKAIWYIQRRIKQLKGE